MNLNPITDIKALVSTLVDDAKIEAQIVALELVSDAELAAFEASQSFFKAKIAELKAQIKPL